MMNTKLTYMILGGAILVLSATGAVIYSNDDKEEANAPIVENVQTTDSIPPPVVSAKVDDEDEKEYDDDKEDDDRVSAVTPPPATVTSPAVVATTPATPAPTPKPAPVTTTKSFTLATLATHNTQADCYTTMDGKVYDLTRYLPIHPGGVEQILPICGKEGGAFFRGQHFGQQKPADALATLLIGTLVP